MRVHRKHISCGLREARKTARERWACAKLSPKRDWEIVAFGTVGGSVWL